MEKSDRKLYRICEGTYGPLGRGNRLAYVGWLGHRNLGDEAMFDAVKGRLNVCPWWTSSLRQRLYKKIVGLPRYFSGVVLGGGTVILGNGEDFRDALQIEKPAWTIGTGVQDKAFWDNYSRPWGGGIPTREWVDLLLRCERITVRGPRSKKILDSLGLPSEVVGDPAILLMKESFTPVSSNKVLGINLGSSNGFLWGENDRKTADCMISAGKVLQREGWLIQLYSVNPMDEEIVGYAAKELGLSNQQIGSYYYDAKKFMKDVSSCRVFLSFRLHAGILALASNVPLIAVEYQPKVADFMESVNSSDRSLRSDRLDKNIIVELVKQINENADQIGKKQHQEALRLKGNLMSLLNSIVVRCRE